MIKALLVDGGGVLFNNVTEESPFFPRLGSRYGVSPADLRAAYAASEPEFETGRTTASLTLREILTRLGGDLDESWAEELRQLYLSCVRPNGDVVAWLRRRPRNGGVRVFLANNEARDWDEAKREAFRHLELFDDAFPSWEVGHVKPEPEFFAAILSPHGLAPHEALVVDDNASCVGAAVALGLQAVLFDGARSLPELW